MVKHIVIFKFKGDEAQRSLLAKDFAIALRELPAKISLLKAIDVGMNINRNENSDLVLTAIVEKMEDVAIYSTHPAHVAAVNIVKDNIEFRACADYEF